jgi:hypothetical protein
MVLLRTCASSDSISSSFALTSPTTCGTLHGHKTQQQWQQHQRNKIGHTPARLVAVPSGAENTASLQEAAAFQTEQAHQT